MKHSILTFSFLTYFILAFGQFNHERVYSTFDNLELPKSDTFNNGADGSGGFTHYGRFFNNSYDDTWGSWSGWSLSNMKDDTTAGFGNQFSAVTGHGLSHTPNYMVSTGDGAYISFNKPTNVTGAYITNSTYAALDMKNGSGFSKKIGGESGDEEDFLKLNITSYLGGLEVSKTDFYLADYRFDNNDKDYIIEDWTYVHLTEEGEGKIVDSITFFYEGSDTGQFGLNTPKYFCMDDFNSENEAYFSTQFSKQIIQDDTFYHGADEAGGFLSQFLFFPNSYNTKWENWSGWSISSKLDDSTEGFDNQFSCINDKRSTFFVSGGQKNEVRGPYLRGDNNLLYKKLNVLLPNIELHITNSTYAALDMRNGSGFSKKFGGESGDDPDFFRLVISYVNLSDSVLATDTIYLADFRFDDNSQDYILDDWIRVKGYDDISGEFHKIKFDLESSDVGMFGMNTPAYFCLDYNFRISNSARDMKVDEDYLLYPNPTKNSLTISYTHQVNRLRILNVIGSEVMLLTEVLPSERINVQNLIPGIYFVELYSDQGKAIKKFIKE